MRTEDKGSVHPVAHARKIKLYAGLVIAGAGLLAVFLIDGAVYIGFGAALLGTGIAPLDQVTNIFKK